MTAFSESSLAPGASDPVHLITDGMMRHALAVLHPDDLPVLESLKHMPDASLLLTRPLIKPSPFELGPMQEDITKILWEHETFPDWSGVGVLSPDNLGATYFDDQSTAQSNPRTGDRGIGSFAAAVSLCSVLPRSATRPVAGRVERAIAGAPGRAHCSIWLGVACRAAVEEYVVTEAMVHRLFGGHAGSRPVRMPVRLAYVQKDAEDSFMPSAAIEERITEAAPPGTPVQFDRVRLRAYRPGTSPYWRLK
jgi:hypothetical protein